MRTAAALACAALAAACTTTATPRQADAACSGPQVAGHRGAPEVWTENTVYAVGAALRRDADWVEIDVQSTADGKHMLMHDATVDRTTSGHGRLDELTAHQIRSFRTSDGLRIPYETTVLRKIAEYDGRLMMEIKGPETSSQIREEVGRVKQYGMLDRTVVTSFKPWILDRVHDAYPRAATVRLANSLDWMADPVAYARAHHLSGFSVQGRHLTPRLVDRLHAAGLTVTAWTADSEADWDGYATTGADVIVTDRPGVARDWRGC